MNLCFTYLHGNVKAKCCPWVYEVFSNAIITPPPHSIMPVIHAKSGTYKTVDAASYNVSKAEFLCSACEGFEEQQDVTWPPLLRCCRAQAMCHQVSGPKSSPAAAKGYRAAAQCWVSTTAHQDSSTALGSLIVILFPIRSKTVSLW